GVEIDAELVREASDRAKGQGLADRVSFVEGDVFEADISQASVVTLYLYPEVNLALRPKLLSELRPGTRVLSNSFDMGDWKPDIHDKSARSSGGILMWIVPADVAGDWRVEAGDDSFELNVSQRFQKVSLRLGGGDRPLAIKSADLRGDRLNFVASATDETYSFSGRVQGDAIEGLVQIREGDEVRLGKWRAQRAPPAN